MHNDYLAQQKFLEGLRQPQGQVPPQQGAPPVGQPQASYSGGSTEAGFGASPVMAQGGFGSPQPQGQVPPQSSNPRFSHTQIQPGFRFLGEGPENPKGVKMTLASMPPKYVLNDGTQVESKWENGQWVPDIDQTGPRSRMLNGGQRQPNAQGEIQQNSMRLVGEPGIPNLIAGLGGPSDYQQQPNAQGGMGASVGQGAYQPTGSYTSPEVFGAANVLAQPAGQTQSTQTAPAAAPQGGARKWTSNDGKYSTEGAMIGFRATQGGDPLTSEMVRIRKKDGVEVDVPLYRLSEEDRQMVMSSPQYDYQIRNQKIGGVNQQTFNRNSMEYSPAGSNYQQMFDPNNPEYAAMRAADQSVVNPQRQALGEPGGSRGLGQINYGQGPSGQNVYADIVPGGTMPVTRPRAATPEEQAYDEKQSQKYKEWRAKQGAAPKAETPSLTTLLSKMTPSQRRDYTKWLQADPNRYANRNAIASQQLQQWENNVASGNLPTYPGSQKSAQGQPAAGKPAAKVDRSSPEVKAALKVASDSNATDEQKRAAAKTLDAAGFTGEEVLEATTKGATSPTTANQPAPTAAASKSREPSERPLRDDVQKAYEIIKGNRSHDRAGNKYLEFANAEKTLKAEGWTDQDISDLRRGKSKKKLPERPNPQQIADMQTRLQSGNVSDAEREVIEDVLKAEGVSLDASPASTPSQPAIPSRSLTSPPGGETTTQSDLLSEQPEYEPPQLAETRIWTNVEGKKLEGIVVEGSIEAAANQPEGQRVITIKRSDGKFFNIPIDQLSEEDIAYIDAKYRMKNPPSSIVGEDGEDFFSRFKKGKAYKYEKPKQTDRKYNTGEKPGPRSKQYQDPGPFNDSIPAEFWNPKPPSEAYRQRMG
jgi:hypothetical protein